VRVIRDAGFHCFGQGIGPLFQVFIGDSDIGRLYNYRDTVGYVRNDIFSAFHAELQKRGIYCHPSQFERWFLSTEHTEQDIDDTIAAADESIRAVAKKF
jgi:glutamate-1-semialdehyde 2,1-aminomutase